MRCPNCDVGMRLEIEGQAAYRSAGEAERGLELVYGFCPECKHLVVILKHGKYRWIDDRGELADIEREEVLYPSLVARVIDIRVPDKYRQPFNEANSVMGVSPKASAALSRRLLQSILWDEYNIKRRNLETEIVEFIQLKDIPSDIAEAVDAVRNIGNFAAHPVKYMNTGEIVDVEPGEAEWLLDVLEALLDFTFVRPAEVQERKNRLNSKLIALGKPPMKS